MLNNKMRISPFAPSPVGYMKMKIEQARERLILATEEPVVLVTASPTSQTDPESHGDVEALEEGLSPVQTRLLLRYPLPVLALTIGIFLTSTSILFFLDRFNMYEATFKFPYPMTLLLFQTLFCELVLLALVYLSREVSHVRPEWVEYLALPQGISWNLSEAMICAPLAISYTIGGAALILCLQYIPINLASSFLTPMILVQLILTKKLSPEPSQSLHTAMYCLCLMVGHAMSYFTLDLSRANLTGFFAGCLAAMTIPLQHYYLKRTLTSHPKHPVLLLHYTLVCSTVMLVPVVFLSGEVYAISSYCYFLDEKGLWLMLLLLCFMSCLSCMSYYLLQSIVTPLTVVVLHFTKSAILEMPITAWTQHQDITWLNILGVFISIIGTGGYWLQIERQKMSHIWS